MYIIGFLEYFPAIYVIQEAQGTLLRVPILPPKSPPSHETYIIYEAELVHALKLVCIVCVCVYVCVVCINSLLR
jgi:hypothetical protein